MSFCTLPKPGDFEQIPTNKFDYLEKSTFKEKIFGLADMLQLTNAEIYEREQIVEKILRILRPYYPNCEVLIFGSSVNGFGFKDCDLDLLFLPFPGYCNLDFIGKGNGDDNKIIPTPSKVRKGLFPREKLLYMEDWFHLKFIQRVIFSQKNFVKSVVFIPAKCPILTIKFPDSHISCDFSASNRLVVYNTELLRLFGLLDFRVRPLLIALRYWAKSLGFIAKNLLSSYAFSLMVIFYLQSIEPPILPSVKRLCELAGYSRVIDGWETAICLDRHNFRSENKTSIDKLFFNFFEFYWNFDFIRNIVSPYHGRPLPIKELKRSHDERIRNFQVTTFSIQDAFILSNNISRNEVMKTSFKFACLIAKKLICKNSTFQSLFNYSVYEEKMYKLTESDCKNDLSFTLQLNYDLCSRLGITDHFESWYKTVCQIVLNVLQYGLLVDCEVIDRIPWIEDMQETPRKKRKLCDNAENFQLLMSIQCAWDFRIMLGRRKDLEFDSDDGNDLPDILRREFKISKYLKGNNEDNYPDFYFLCNCYRFSTIQVPDVFIAFSPISDVEEFERRKNFLKSYLQKYVKKILDVDYLNYCF